MYVVISVALAGLVLGGIGGYLVGRYQVALINRIRTLEGQVREPVVVEEPTVTMGAYDTTPQLSQPTDLGVGAGLVEAKTPEQLDWENRNEMAKLEQGG